MIPEGWKTLPLGSHVDILSGYPFKSSEFTDDAGKTPLIRIRDLAKQELKTFYMGEYEEKFLIRSGDVLIGMDGDFTIVKWRVRPSLLNQRICRVVGKGEADTDFLYYLLVDEISKIHAVTGATTVKHLSVKDIKGLMALLPPLPEQKKIASILTSVDEAIEKQEAQISKLQDLKKAMMQELFTKGIGHTEFKDSPVGRIPKGWEALTVGDIATVKRGASPRPIKNPKWWGGKVGWVRISDITSAGKFLTKTTDYLSRAGVEKSVRIKLDDVIVSICATIGRPIIVKADVCIHDGFVWFDKLSGAVDRHFLYYFFLWKEKYLSSQRQTGTQGNLNTSIVSILDLPLPPKAEQKKIAAILTSIDDVIEAKRKKLSHTMSLKKSLMQDLLTGKVRVIV